MKYGESIFVDIDACEKHKIPSFFGQKFVVLKDLCVDCIKEKRIFGKYEDSQECLVIVL